jgi:2-keto-4-pentenoate hydratase/2-oxohepta-3-ene-1,7-dioic acid hydratase in catechol pathway
MVAAVIGNEASKVSADEVRSDVFGYTLVNDWRARSADGSPVASADGVPISVGPCVVTADDLDPQAMFVRVRVDERDVLKGNLNGTATSLFELIASVSQHAVLERGDAFALGPFPPVDDDADPSRRLWPGAVVELSAEGIGTLRNRLAAR